MILSPVALMLGLVIGQRLGELVIARRNTQRLLAAGAREIGARHYPLFILLHASWLAAIAIFVPLERRPNPELIGVYLLLQLVRIWIISTLGPYWTTRVITLDGAPIVRGGPFRFVRHPNYLVVVAEIAVLPLAFDAWRIAIVFSLLNGALLAYRIHVEEAALRPRVEGS